MWIRPWTCPACLRTWAFTSIEEAERIHPRAHCTCASCVRADARAYHWVQWWRDLAKIKGTSNQYSRQTSGHQRGLWEDGGNYLYKVRDYVALVARLRRRRRYGTQPAETIHAKLTETRAKHIARRAVINRRLKSLDKETAETT